MRHQLQKRIEEAIRHLKAAMEHDETQCAPEAFLLSSARIYLDTWVVRYLEEILEVENGKQDYKMLYQIR